MVVYLDLSLGTQPITYNGSRGQTLTNANEHLNKRTSRPNKSDDETEYFQCLHNSFTILKFYIDLFFSAYTTLKEQNHIEIFCKIAFNMQ